MGILALKLQLLFVVRLVINCFKHGFELMLNSICYVRLFAIIKDRLNKTDNIFLWSPQILIFFNAAINQG